MHPTIKIAAFLISFRSTLIHASSVVFSLGSTLTFGNTLSLISFIMSAEKLYLSFFLVFEVKALF
ncbi:hypothetical protein C2G38_2106858 [Gigaspora rosea]|uniref:Uncharacterized protein n=1 Tax=Gigaspora rosea TaxID=44941 RepID=A0A397UMX8_9GLOM|nr:hypothetical protein C2G38_2106858 [Gigaspora rosea]